jgi:hypothetical protein
MEDREGFAEAASREISTSHLRPPKSTSSTTPLVNYTPSEAGHDSPCHYYLASNALFSTTWASRVEVVLHSQPTVTPIEEGILVIPMVTAIKGLVFGPSSVEDISRHHLPARFQNLTSVLGNLGQSLVASIRSRQDHLSHPVSHISRSIPFDWDKMRLSSVVTAFMALGGGLVNSASTHKPARPPAYPLAVRSPYVNVWLQNDKNNGGELPGTWPRFWQ